MEIQILLNSKPTVNNHFFEFGVSTANRNVNTLKVAYGCTAEKIVGLLVSRVGEFTNKQEVIEYINKTMYGK